ncbi:response regulator transcription factor [Aliishimia ponticola]|nr:response regulator transcription factor [Aliishimia ponticola]
MFRDLIAQAVDDAGHEVSTILDDLSGGDSLPAEAVVVIICRSTENDFCANLRELRGHRPDLAIAIVCPTRLEQELVRDVGDCVNGIFPDDKPISLILASLPALSEGYRLVPPARAPTSGIQVKRVTHENCRDDDHGTPQLSSREETVLERILGGQSNKEIARDLGISDSTVKVHMRSIFRKIGVRNRTQAAMWATRQN